MKMEEKNTANHDECVNLDEIKNELLKHGKYLELVIEILASWAEAGGVSLISGQQLCSPSANRNEKIRMLLQEIGELEKASGTDEQDRYRMQKSYTAGLPGGGRIDIEIKADARLTEGDSERALSEIGIAARQFYMELAEKVNKTL